MSVPTPAKLKDIKVCGFSLLHIRLCWYSVSFLHLLVTAVVTLTIDVTVDEDPMVRAYNHVRWKLITFVFKVTLLFYLPLYLYCDVREYLGQVSPRVEKLRSLLDEVMTIFLVPVIKYSDVTFWILYYTYPNIIAPPQLLKYLSYWAQHSLHSVSMVTVVMDLMLTPRRRPGNLEKRAAILVFVGTLYSLFRVYACKVNGEYVYAFLETSSLTTDISMYFAFLLIVLVTYYSQWHFIHFFWGNYGTRIEKSIKVK
ncbi:unnamed protein product [Chrysodeixis includens]|uniref:Uncharacterized protein n=1 Tax=Chrysodeixis includens TaxID=689277 RepID=A0A9N8KWN4_CHRIL|nr:unnamed protein product [Chrysodeixis includens]